MPYPLLRRAAAASVLSLMTVVALSTAASAQLRPVLISSGFTTDDVYTGAGDATVGNFDAKNGYNFYSLGSNTNAATTGLPAVTITNGTDIFQMQNYTNANNALQLAGGSGTTFGTSGTLTLNTAARYSSIGILSASANGATPVNVTFNYVGGTTSTASFTSNDWFGSNQFYTAGGRVNLTGGTAAFETNGNNPGLYENILTPSTTFALQSITFTTTATGNTGQSASIFAINGLAAPEPGSVALAGLGLLGVVAPILSRRRK